jgi:hypothetical protein
MSEYINADHKKAWTGRKPKEERTDELYPQHHTYNYGLVAFAGMFHTKRVSATH